MTYEEDIARMTQGLIDELYQKLGIDYNSGRSELTDLVESQMNGNWDNTTYFGTSTSLRDIRVIQEDEYDQSMDEDEKPDWDRILFQGELGYVLFA
jgi:hypothetical protein